MKKRPRKRLIKLLDIAFSKKIRERGSCEKCHGVQYLQCAHIYSRIKQITRWNPLNALCLCYNCHFNFAHKYPLDFAEWLKDYYGLLQYDLLRKMSKNTAKFTTDELESLLEELC